MKEIFNNIITWLQKNNRDTMLNRLLDGSNDNIYRKIFKKTTLEIPNELIELYKISLGVNINEGDKLNRFHFFPGFYFMAIEESILDYNIFKNDSRWNKNWFPIFANGGGDFYCVDCSDKNKSPIVEFMLDYDDEVVHDSILNMLKTIDQCYKEKVYYVDDENYLEIDDYKKENSIRKRINGYDIVKKSRFLLDD